MYNMEIIHINMEILPNVFNEPSCLNEATEIVGPLWIHEEKPREHHGDPRVVLMGKTSF